MATHTDRMTVAHNIARWLRRRFGEVIADVRLYGSVARKSDGADSDVDLLVLVTRRLSSQERRELSERAYDEDLRHGTITLCMVRTLEEWERPEVQCGGLAREVAREGVRL